MSEVICPNCKNPIYDENALLCHFCGNSLRRSSSGLLGRMSGAGMKWVMITVAGLIILSFVFMLMF